MATTYIIVGKTYAFDNNGEFYITDISGDKVNGNYFICYEKGKPKFAYHDSLSLENMKKDWYCIDDDYLLWMIV